jgi:hypothetical protein
MVLVNRRRRPSELPVLPSLSVDIVRGADRLRPIHATVERMTADTVVVACGSGVDALAVAMSPDLELTFRGPGLEVTMTARPGKRVDDIHGHRYVELVLDQDGRAVRLLS